MNTHQPFLTVRQLWVAVGVLVCLLLVPARAHANDYLEQKYHYSVYTAGQDKIHFKIPVWAYGAVNDYLALPTSHFSYKVEGGQETEVLAWGAHARKDNNQDNGRGTVAVKLKPNQGEVIVTSMHSGVNYAVYGNDRWTSWLTVNQGSDTECDRITFLEFDWYPPLSLDSLTFSVRIYVSGITKFWVVQTWMDEDNIEEYFNVDSRYELNWWMDQSFTSTNNSMTPQLYDPYLYQLNENGVAGYGYAAIPYAVFDDPASYTTNYDTTTVKLTDDSRAGSIYVMTSDTLLPDFHADFSVWRSKEAGTTRTLRSTSVNVAPYHRIYNFNAYEETDSTGTFTGNNVLTWNIKNPTLTDIVDGDYFVVERAMDSTFADAEQLRMLPLQRDSAGVYSFTDESRKTWTGNMTDDSVDYVVSRRVDGYILRDQQGKPVYELDLRLSSNKVMMPSIPVYYRIARGSATIWGWDSEFVSKATMFKNNYLAPLADVQEDYTVDSDKHEVNFRIRLDNREVASPALPSKEDFAFTYYVKTNLKENLRIHTTLSNPYNAPVAYLTVEDPDGVRLVNDEPLDTPRDFNAPRASHVTVRYAYAFSPFEGYTWLNYSFDLGTDVDILFEKHPSSTNIRTVSVIPHDYSDTYVTDAVLQHLKDSLYSIFQQEYVTQVYGRCMWDKSASLVLIRTIAETGRSSEFVIPQDSIRRQEDGSWLATFSNVADQACLHYSYAVRIDQSRSDLRLQHPETQLQPMALHGPDLYFDEGAEIRSFLATRGATQTEMKRGVHLHWVPTNQSVDRYILQRKVANSDRSDTTLYVGLETSFFDDTAQPDVHYEYTVTAKFNCNGTGTSNSATTIGWRTPYGEISGVVMLTDNSGMNGVDVALQADGSVIRTMRTDATGAYKFDSLAYDLTGSTTYAVVPTHPYAQFSFNNTSTPTASIALSADNAVASGINFVNLSSVRLTGRVLYKNSTVPVAGALFLLNGDTIRRGGAPLLSGVDGNFEIIVPESQPCQLQVSKAGHVFEGDGILHVVQGQDSFALTEPLDGVRFYDLTKVRLVGRVAGGNNQRDLPEAFGVGTNNLGDNLQLVLQLEGDNTAHFVHDPNDLTRDTMQQHFTHIVYTTDTLSTTPERQVGETNMLMDKRRITISPDPLTGEFEVDLFPVKYKVIQAQASGYASLFAAGQAGEVIDLTDAPMYVYTATYNALMGRVIVTKRSTQEGQETDNTEIPYTEAIRNGDLVRYNATYDRIYHNPVKIELVQNIYGLERKGFGEPEMEVNSLHGTQTSVALYTENDANGVNYTLGYPVFISGRTYQFKAKAYEEYRYNNIESGTVDRVPQRGGNVIVRNGLHHATSTATYPLNAKGENSAIWLEVDNLDVENAGTTPLRNVSVALEMENNVVETNVFSAFVSGSVVEGNSLRSSDGGIQLLDIIRDPGGAGSFAYVENGSSYSVDFTQSVKAEFGIELQPTWGKNLTQYIGVYTGAEGGGSWTGQQIQTQKAFSFSIPISYKMDFGTAYSYKLTTNERVSTSSSSTLPTAVGTPADVFLGTTMANIVGKAKTISIIDDSLYQACQPSFDAGAMLLLAQGEGADGTPYYLVTGQKIVVGAAVNNTFAYSQQYVLATLIPRLAMERQSLLMQFNDSAEAQAYADQLGRPVYWYRETGSYLYDTIPLNSHAMFAPNDGNIYTDEVEALNNHIAGWLTVIYTNEMEKVLARTKGMKIGTYSVSSGIDYSYSEEHECSYSYNELPVSMAGERLWKKGLVKAAGTLFSRLAKRGLMKFLGKSEVTSAASALESYYQDAFKVNDDGNLVENPDADKLKKVDEVTAQAPGVKFSMKFVPINNMGSEKRMTTTTAISKHAGFTIVPDPAGEISVSVYKAEFDETWAADTEEVLEELEQSDNDGFKYGSFVFYTEGGATMCPHEDAETTDFYNPGTPLHNNTEWVAKPELTADVYEKTNVAPDKRATFRIQLFNQGQMDAGLAEEGMGFYLCIDGASNPDGAKVYVNGAPLIQSLYYWIAPGQPITQTVEVERGTVDDYDLTFILYSENCPKTAATMNLGVHFLPLSTDVQIEMPRQNWVMNTLSPRDSAGYYLPITIDGFDIHHKNFDHIEFQYKLATQSDDDWVNQCSFYASDSLYDLASGSKAMIENGRIVPFRFYGERDPMEQRYALRAVSFCRYGSGYVTKASPVISGTKDTRTPVVFGEPEPANSILGVGDHLKLRFNEAIAGNYLDEDNNFQITGITNQTGLAAATALHFDGNASATTRVKRDLTDKSFTVDMMIRPSMVDNRTEDMILFETGNEQYTKQFILTKDNRLRMVNTAGKAYVGRTSKPIGSLMAFARVLFVYEKGKKMRFFVGTTEYTDRLLGAGETDDSEQGTSAEFKFGTTYDGDMLETRIWTKALTLEEIAATADHSLTGYERELLAYYPMNEGKGETISDLAHGATLYLDGCSWNKQQGFSLRLDGTQRATLDGNLLGRSSSYDETLMFWFKAEANGTLFSADRHEATDSTTAKGTSIALEQGRLVLYNGQQSFLANGSFVGDGWHHFVLTVNRTFGNASLYIDGKMYQAMDAISLEGITGAMYLGGNGFRGNIDEFVIFEQALPKSLVETYQDIALSGDEMGLMAYLPFEEQFLNPNGVLEQRFSINDRRQFIDPGTGEVIDKVVPLVTDLPDEGMADGTANAPVKSHGLLKKLHFNWAFNNDELMINILNRDYEVNKQSVYVTVRDVEDLNGNPMVSPVTWTAFVDRNSLKWSDKQLLVKSEYDADYDRTEELRIINQSGKRHTYTIESLPAWLTANILYGAIDPMEEQRVVLTFSRQMPVGEYSDIIYLTDENGLSEPLTVEFQVEAFCPWDELNSNAYDNSMSLRGQVLMTHADGTAYYDTDEEDIVAVFCDGEMVGKTNITVNNITGTSYVYLTIYGNASMAGGLLSFKLWQKSSGSIFALTPSIVQRYQNNGMRGYAPNEPIQLVVNANAATQQVALSEGWNWISWNLAPASDAPNSLLTYGQGFQNGDIVKSPAGRQFAIFNVADTAGWVGSLTHMDWQHMFMVRTSGPLTLNVEGNVLTDEQRAVTIYGKCWSSISYLLDTPMPVDEALADYYTHASVGDVIKSKDVVAVFSENGRWEGSLQTMRPGQGYLFLRQGSGDVTMRYIPASQAAPQREVGRSFSNPQASTNMTMVAVVKDLKNFKDLKVFVNGDLAAIAAPQVVDGDTLYFLTIQSDGAGTLRFETADGTTLTVANSSPETGEVARSAGGVDHSLLHYTENSHLGTVEAPIVLRPTDSRPYKIIEDNHVVIIREGEKYDATGKKLKM